MIIRKLSDMKNGWMIGDFEPTMLNTNDFEFAIKHMKKGDADKLHFHKIAKEFTVMISGEALMKQNSVKEGDVIIVEPNEISDFLALTDCVLAVIKVPSVKNDKYEAEDA